MPLYNCDICEKQFNQRSHYTRHINRIYPCDLLKNNNINKCKYCESEFTKNSSLNRHINENRCKVKKTLDNDKEEIFQKLLSEIKELKISNNRILRDNETLKKKIGKSRTNTFNNSSINNGSINNGTINNIKIVAFGKEDISHISDKEWLQILNKNYKSIQDLTLKTHFDNNKPENQNIYISNLRSKYIMVHNGNKWEVKDRKDTVDDLYDEKAYIIFNKVDELTKKLPIRIVDKFNEIKTGYDEDKIRKVLLKELDMTLYNQRNIPIYTHKIKDN